jgi:signal transduction histidine kinase
MRCIFECDEPVLLEDNLTAMHLYRIAQEAVTNMLKHGRAKRITLHLACNDHALALKIQGDGESIQLRTAEQSTGLGLRIMRYRASLLNGTLNIAPADGGGTCVTCAVPRALSHEPK